jgi:5-enolpyruvylshikimate-3-phosphate synthase
LVILGLAGDSPVNIERVDCIAKSYPEFFDDLDALGARMQIQILD